MITPTVTIAMPVWNCEATLPASLASIQAQTFENWSLELVDDGSTDGTVDLAMEAARVDKRIHAVVDQHHKEIAVRLNEVIERTDTEFFARMDGDDIAYPERFAIQLERIVSDARLDLVGGSILIFRDGGVAIGCRRSPLMHEQICAHPHRGFALPHVTFFGKTALFRRFRYRPSARLCEDQDFLARASRTARYANSPDLLVGYRENRLRMRKQLRARRHLALHLAEIRWRLGDHRGALIAIPAQLLRASVDVAAITTGTEESLLVHRYQPLSDVERSSWRSIWDAATRNQGAVGAE
ncbi:MAG: glycosyltransferase family 2 protein [Candidatus Dormiibacterota bacterium]